MSDTPPIDFLAGTETILRALQGRMAQAIAAGKSVSKSDQRQLVELTERVERVRARRDAAAAEREGGLTPGGGEAAGPPAPDQAMPVPAHEEGQGDPSKCGGRTRSGGRCGQAAGWGTDHPGVGRCKLHLGSTRNLTLAAQKEVAVREVRAVLGIPKDVDPASAILDALAEANGNVEVLRRKVANPDNTEALIDYQGKPHTNPVLAFYNEERDRLARYAKLANDMRIDEVRVRLARAQGQRMAEVVQVVVDACNPTEAERVAAMRAAGEVMRTIGAGGDVLG